MSDRTPEEINDLRKENMKQNERISHIETEVSTIKTALIGIDGKNGMRREMAEIRAAVDTLAGRSWDNIKKFMIILGGIGTMSAIIIGVIKLVP